MTKPKAKSSEEPLVRVATAPNELLAKMWAEILENEGIHSVLKSNDLAATMFIPHIATQCEIYVLASKAEEAKEILTSLTQDDLQKDE